MRKDKPNLEEIEAFEVWAKEDVTYGRMHLDHVGNQLGPKEKWGYINSTTATAWRAWQASKKHVVSTIFNNK